MEHIRNLVHSALVTVSLEGLQFWWLILVTGFMGCFTKMELSIVLVNNLVKIFFFIVIIAGRWRWSLIVVGIMLLVCLTALIIYFLRDYVKSKFLDFM